MRKLIGWGLMIGLIWVGITIYTEGARNAFGGAFSFLVADDGAAERARDYVSTPKRMGEAVKRHVDEGADRYDEYREE